MLLIFLAGGIIALAHWTRSTFIQIMSGVVAIIAGIAYIGLDSDLWTYISIGAVVVAVGIFQLIMVAVDLLKGD